MPSGSPGIRPRIEAALALAARSHARQVRKGTETPYIVHPMSVGWLLDRHGFDEDLVCAGLLHDTVEDTDLGLDEIRNAFGDGVAALVDAVSEKKVEDGHKRPWRQRKSEALEHLRHADSRVAALKAADLLHNLSSTLHELRATGPSVWQRFNAPPADWIGYHADVVALIGERLGDHALTDELRRTLAELVALSG